MELLNIKIEVLKKVNTSLYDHHIEKVLPVYTKFEITALVNEYLNKSSFEGTQESFNLPFHRSYFEFKIDKLSIDENLYFYGIGLIVTQAADNLIEGEITVFAQSRTEAYCVGNLFYIKDKKLFLDKRNLERERKAHADNPEALRFIEQSFTISGEFLPSFPSMLNTLNDTQYKNVPVVHKESANAKRLSKGKKALVSHYVYDINITEDVAIRKYCEATGRSTPKKYHSRRGHTRRLSSGKSVWVKSCWAGNRALGVITKDYRIKIG